MATKLSSRTVFISIGVVIVLSVLNAYVLKNTFATRVLGWIGSPGAYIFERSSVVRSIVSEFKHIRNLTAENAHLRQEGVELLARVGQREALEDEIDFLRRSLKVPTDEIVPVMTAGLFTVDLVPPHYNALINRGSDDGVVVGQIVVTGESVLVGRITEVLSTFSRVQLVNDPGLEVAARVLGRATMGITKGNLDQGISLNLVVQEDEISEGDTVVSNGHDAFPPGLIIGRVVHVESNESTVFKKVRLDPVMQKIPLGPVLLLRP